MTIRDIAIAFGYKVDEQSAKKAEDGIKNLKGMATKLLGAIGIGFSLVGLNEIADEFNGINDQIRNATSGLGEQKEIQQKILNAANDSKMSYKDTAKFVGLLVQENKDLFATVEDATEYASLTSKLFMSAGKSQEEVASLQEAINKSFAKGIVDSETINQLYERAPEAINMIAESLGVAKENLGKMATDGTLSLADLKNAFVNNADTINKQFDGLNFSISDALKNIRNKWGLFVSDMNETLGITKTISKFMVRGFSSALDGLKKVLTWVDKVAERVGGLSNLLKIIAVVGGGIWAVLNAAKIIEFLKIAKAMIFSMGKGLSAIQLKVLAVVAVIALLFLIIDDIINFVKGNDSVIGSLFDKAGIDAEKARETIKGAWKVITDFLLKAWETIKKIGEKIWGGLSRFWAENGKEVMDSLSEVWDTILTVVGAVWDALSDTAHAVFDALKAFWDKWGDKIKKLFAIIWKNVGEQVMAFLKIIRGLAEFISGVFSGDWSKAWNGIKTVFVGIFDSLLSFINNIWSAILTVFTGSAGDAEGRMEKMRGFLSGIWEGIKTAATTIFNALKAFWDRWGAQITAQFQIVWDYLGGLIGAFLQVVRGIIDFIAGIFTGDWDRVWQGIKGIFEGIWNAISSFFMAIWGTIYNWFGDKIEAIKTTLVNGFNGAIEFMQSLPAQALQWGRDFIDGLVNGIKEKVAAVVDAVKGIGEKIKSFLHFSTPDEGPLADYESWMPDFMSGMARGIRENSPKVLDAIKALTKDMAIVSDVSVKSSTATAVQGGGSRTTNVNQTNNIKNEFKGGDRAAQTQGAKAMGKSAEDATGYLARGLAYGR